MQFELLIIITSIIVYSMKYKRYDIYKKQYENNKIYNLNNIVIYK